MMTYPRGTIFARTPSPSLAKSLHATVMSGRRGAGVAGRGAEMNWVSVTDGRLIAFIVASLLNHSYHHHP